MLKTDTPVVQITGYINSLNQSVQELRDMLNSSDIVSNYDSFVNMIDFFALDLMDASILVADIRINPTAPMLKDKADELSRLVDSLRYSLRFFLDSRIKIR